jgi:small-conductance mechanosensitive channel
LIAWLLRTVAVLGCTALGAIVVTLVLAKVLARRPALHALVRFGRTPLIALATAVALRASMFDVPLHGAGRAGLRDASAVASIAAAAWLVTRGISVLEAGLSGRFDVTVRDNRRARARRTQLQVLRRVAAVAVVILALVVSLRSFPWGRELGTSLLATGGVIGIVIGITGRSTIGNLIAGIQIAFAEPIRLDDVVVVEGEWGRIEEITLTYVVMRIWDDRRLVLPTSYFVEQPFQNWTRHAAELHGTVELWVDHAADVEELRACFAELAARSEHWDGRTAVLQVTDATPHALKVRALVSAVDASTLWDLRCELREKLARWIADTDAAVPWLRLRSTGDVPVESR